MFDIYCIPNDPQKWGQLSPVIRINTEAQQILSLVRQLLGLSEAYVCSEGTQRKKTYARHLYCYLCETETDITQDEIALLFDFTPKSVIYARKRIENLLCVDKAVQCHVLTLKNLIGGVRVLKGAA